MKNVIELFKQNQIDYLENEPMKKYTSFKTGGNSKVFVEPKSEAQLEKILQICSENSQEVFVLGNGSNLLVSDNGIDAVVVHMSRGMDEMIMLDETTIKVGAGASLTALCNFALKQSLSGLEFAFGIPGSVGGAVMMNAGAYGGQMQDVLYSTTHMDKQGNQGSLNQNELDLDYRKSAYTTNGLIITSAVLKLKKGNQEQIKADMKELMQRRKDKQPLEYPSAGSTFKRPEGYFAGALIEQSGLKKMQVGGAMVSEKHAGFIINYDNATTNDILNLIEVCKQKVKEKFDVELETEVKFV